MNERLENLFDSVSAGEWGSNQGAAGGIDTGVIRSANFTKDHKFNSKEIVVRSIEERKRKRKLLCHGDILIEKSGGSPDQPVGRVLFYDLDGEHTCSNFISILRPSRQADPKFIYYSMCNLYERGVVKHYQQQTTGIINLQLGEYLQESIFLPSFPEQKKIAEILSGIDRVINGYMTQLKHRRLFCGAFIDKEVSHSKSNRNLVPIGEVAIQSKKKGIGNLPIYSVSVEHGMIRRDSLERSLISNLDQKDNLYASKGDFCYNMMRMWQGASGIAPEDCLVSPAYVVCRPTNAILPDYLAIACRSKELIDKFRSSSRGITSDRWRLYYEDFAKIEIPLPSKSEQYAIVARNTMLRSSTSKLEQCLQKIMRLKESISSDLLSGRKRVSV
jgi:type I restriction enzyme S subunit